ncbi:MAG: hypothetical protein J5I93_03215 [Pirellulaceae bacterium]|nr:hypothetical protein [Pirellulaceae bacterium]
MDTRRVVISLPLAGLPALPSAPVSGRHLWENSPPPTQNSPPVQGLLFHLQNVLFDDTAWRRWLLRLLHHMGLHSPYDAFFRLWETECLEDSSQDAFDYWQALRGFLSSAGMTRGQIDEVEAAGRLRRERLNQQTRPFPAVSGTLARLHEAGVRMVALDTGCGELRDPLQPLRDGNLERWFQAVVAPARRSDRAANYHRALAALDVPLDRVALVGQDPGELDWAAAGGLRTIAFNAPRHARADVHLSHFPELVQHCGATRLRRRAG